MVTLMERAGYLAQHPYFIVFYVLYCLIISHLLSRILSLMALFSWDFYYLSRVMLFAYAKTKVQISFAVTVKLISTFVFATWLVQFLYFLDRKLPASTHLLCLYSSVFVRHSWFSHDVAHFFIVLKRLNHIAYKSHNQPTSTRKSNILE